MNRVKIYEDRERKNKSLKEEQEYLQKLYEQNRANMRERMRKLKQFIKDKKDLSKTSEEFFQKYKDFFFNEYGIKSYDELIKLINNYDRENPDEVQKELIEKYKKNLKIEKQVSKDGKNGFSIVPQTEKFVSLEISNINSENKNFAKKKFKKELKKSNEINDLNIIPNIKEYMTEKIKSYEINNLKDDNISFPKNKKIKYDPETELIISSNNINVFLEKNENKMLSKGENYTENGIPINELIEFKIKKFFEGLSEYDKNNYKKVEQIIKNMINNKNNINEKNFFKTNFCIDCNQNFDKENKEQCSLHNEHNIINIDNIFNDLDEELNKNINELDYNEILNKIYKNLKEEQNTALKYGKNILINFYGDLLFYLYEIILNNNSIEDLNESIININELYKTNIESQEEKDINKYFKTYFLFYVQRITKWSYYKLKKIEKIKAELFDVNNINNLNIEDADIVSDNSNIETQNDFLNSFKVKVNNIDKNFEKDIININNTNKQLENEDNIKYFFRLGLDIKFKYGKTQSINDLYNKAKENEIEPQYYETFIKNELNIEK